MPRTSNRIRDAQALSMRLSGLSYDAMAAELGYRNHSGAWKAVHRALRRTEQQDADKLRAMELERTEDLLRAWAPLARGETFDDGTRRDPDPEAARIVLKVIALRTRLLGLEQPRVAATPTVQRPPTVHFIMPGPPELFMYPSEDAEELVEGEFQVVGPRPLGQ